MCPFNRRKKNEAKSLDATGASFTSTGEQHIGPESRHFQNVRSPRFQLHDCTSHSLLSLPWRVRRPLLIRALGWKRKRRETLNSRPGGTVLPSDITPMPLSSRAATLSTIGSCRCSIVSFFSSSSFVLPS